MKKSVKGRNLLNQTFLFGVLFLSSVSAHAATDAFFQTLSLPEQTEELRVAIDYDLRCNEENPGFGAVRGEIRLPDRIVRFDLYLGNHHTEILLGRASANEATVHVEPSPTCEAFNLRFTVSPLTFGEDFPSILQRYSPFFVVRKNQLGNRDTDVPLSLTYNIFRPSPSRRIIQYSLYYTDEDSKRRSTQEEAQMARYGRRLDIQWAYRVEIDEHGEKIREWFQGGILRTGIGHKTFRFRGATLPNTDHPILYDIANHNTYSDQPCFGLDARVGYSFAEMNEVPEPTSREDELFKNPWMLQASDLELAREGKLAHASPDYLYVLVQGKMNRGALAAKIELSNGDTFTSGGGNGSFDRLGEDTWEREAFTAIPVGYEKLQKLFSDPGVSARFSFTRKGLSSVDAKFASLRFFVLTPESDTYRVTEVTDHFHCFYPVKGLPSCGL